MDNLSIFCADVGSIRANKFGWAGLLNLTDVVRGTCIEDFVDRIAGEIRSHRKVALGFECPLFVPLRDNPLAVNIARHGEGNRSWSAGAGTGALATGLVEVAWVLRHVAALLPNTPKATFSWEEFLVTKSVYLWEAFVTSSAKGSNHAEDALIAVEIFHAALPDPESANAILERDVLSLAGAAALRAGWSADIDLLRQPCLVIKA